jgi:glycosyltransferase involved in cell wall biosynthesis
VKILHTIPHYAPAWGWGGPVTALVELAHEQARQGHEVTVLTTDRDVNGKLQVPLRRAVPMEGVQIWYCPSTQRAFDFSPYASCFLRTRAHRFDIIHVHTLFSWIPTMSAIWALRRRIPYFLLPQGALSPICLSKSYDIWTSSLRSRAKKWVYFKTLSRIVLDRASALQFCSEQEKDDARPLALKAPSFVIPLGVAPLPADVRVSHIALRERFPLLRNRPIVLYLSRLDPIKGLDLLIAALGNLNKSGYQFGFVVAGGGPEPYEREIHSLVDKHGIVQCTFFLGPTFDDSKLQVLQEADLFALTSRHENFGLAVLEAMRAGLPVVVSRSVGIHREITRCGAGIATELDPDEIAFALKQLLGNDFLRHEMGRRGQQLVYTRFAWPRVVESLTNAYERTIKAASDSPVAAA